MTLKQPIQCPPIWVDVIRHGETAFNAARAVSGRADVDLTTIGEEQARMAATYLMPLYGAAWSSSLYRSKRTLNILLQSGIVRAEVLFDDARLDERSLGILEGRPHVRIDAYSEGDLKYAPPEGESYLSLAQRLLSFLIDLVAFSNNVPNLGTALLCTHIGPMRILTGIFEEDSDPVLVLNRNFSNAQIMRFPLRTLKLPKFLKGFV
jgi:probable phosphoglycerate mutase